MMTRSLLFLAAATLIVAAPLARAQDDIQTAMSPGEFKKSGLDKLSPEELANLNRWLAGDREKTAKKAAARTARTKLDFLVSRVDGSFTGLTGATVVHLQDGTVWKQANSDDRFHGSPVENPGAAVVHGTFGYKMRIEGAQEFYVDPVRR